MSSDQIATLCGSTMTLTKDFTAFLVRKSVESLPEDYQNQIGSLTSSVPSFLHRAHSITAQVLSPVVSGLLDIIRRCYEELNRQSAQVIDPLVRDFESRYPSSAGRIGTTLLDRFLVIMWLLLLVRIFILCLRGLRRILLGKPKKHHRKPNKQFKADPLFGNPVTPPQTKSSAPSSCSSGNATPEKRPEPPSALRTVKKRIVISR